MWRIALWTSVPENVCVCKYMCVSFHLGACVVDRKRLLWLPSSAPHLLKAVSIPLSLLWPYPSSFPLNHPLLSSLFLSLSHPSVTLKSITKSI